MSNAYDAMSTSDKLIKNDIVIPTGLHLPVWAKPIKGRVVNPTMGVSNMYDVEFDGHTVSIFRKNLTLYNPWLVPGDKVKLVPDDPEQVESLLRLSTTEEMATEIGVVTKVANGWGGHEWAGDTPANEETRTPNSFWYYTVRWPSGHEDQFLHDGDLCRVDEEE